MDYKVDRVLWESLEGIFQIHGRNYVRDLARRLKVDDKELLRKVFGPESKTKISIVDSGETSTQCKAYVRSGSIVHYCRKAVQSGTAFCPCHQILRPNIIESMSGFVEVRKLPDAPDREALWVKEDGEVIGVDGLFRGTYDETTGRLRLFLVAED